MSCDCPESNPYAADAAFVGTVVDEWRPRLVPFIRERQLTVEVDEVLTGEVPAVVRFTYRQGLCRSGIPVGPMLTFYVSDRLGDTPEITLGCVPVAPEEARALRDTTMQEPWGDPIAEAIFTQQR